VQKMGTDLRTEELQTKPARSLCCIDMEQGGQDIRTISGEQRGSYSLDGSLMAYEYLTSEGPLDLVRSGQRWFIKFNGCLQGQWLSPDEAAKAAAGHRTGLSRWDQAHLVVPDDLLRWRPLGESL
jgi:hypothetical protein